MIFWFKKENYSEYRGILFKAFPKILKSDVEAVLNILPFDINNVKLTGGQYQMVDNLIHSTTLTIQLDHELLTIPYRIYFNEPDSEKESKLTDKQQIILNCIYLRHHNGYLRQKRLNKLVDKNEYWLIPFTIQFLGEYVNEILQVLDKHVNDKTIDNYVRFVNENLEYWQQTESRMISYWNEYYRKLYPKLKDYIGWQIADRINKHKHNGTWHKKGKT
ncbi:MAG: hypothetical protein HUU47_03470 [Bacteroidetes bacterium]|nr:hypothetical protein [Bacteroidota bacterium]